MEKYQDNYKSARKAVLFTPLAIIVTWVIGLTISVLNEKISNAAGMVVFISSFVGIIFELISIFKLIWAKIKLRNTERETFLEKEKQKILDDERKKREEEQRRIDEEQKKAAEIKRIEEEKTEASRREEAKRLHAEKIQRIKNDPAEYERLKNMCSDVEKEIKDLLKDYRNLDICEDYDRMCWILKEWHRKVSVIKNTKDLGVECDFEVYDEFEKIEKKSKSFINAFIKNERESGTEDYDIDISQFTDDLWFIGDYIFQKEEKLQKELYNI